MRATILSVVLVALAGCAAGTHEKPMITARAFEHIASACGATKPDVHRTKNNPLPFVSAQLPATESVEGNPTPVFGCINSRLTKYRYDMFGFTYAKTKSP